LVLFFKKELSFALFLIVRLARKPFFFEKRTKKFFL